MKKNSLRNQNILRHIFFLTVIISSMIVIINIPRITIPLALAYVLYLITSPIYEKMINAKVPSIIANLIIIFSFVFVLVSPLSSILPLIESQSQNFDSYLPKSEFYIKKYYY